MIESIKQCNPKALEIKVRETIISFKQKQFLERVEKEYEELYPEYKEEKTTNILGDIISTKKVKIEYNEYYAVEVDENGNEVKKYIKEYNPKLPDRPTYEYFIQLKRDEYKPEVVTDEDYSFEPVQINTTNEFEIKMLEELNQFKISLKESILDKIQEVADLSYNKAKAYLADKKNLTIAQVERYKTKYALALKAKDGDEDAKVALQLEAELAGKDINDLIDLIIELGNNWEKELNYYTTKIEAIRVAVKKLLSVNPKKAIHVISVGATLPVTVSDEEIKKLFDV